MVTITSFSLRAFADVDPAARVVANASLETFRKLVRPENAVAIGFDSYAQVANAVLGLGDPFEDYFVRLDRLREYAGGSPDPLLQPGSRVVFPILIDQKARASVTVVRAGASWKAGMFGSAQLTQAMVATRTLLAKREQPGTGFFLVRVPGLQRTFIGYRKNGKLILTPLAKRQLQPQPQAGQVGSKLDEAGYVLEPGKPAEETFKGLAPLAKKTAERGAPG